MKGKPSFGPLTFGFDIGIASVGWAVFAPNFIVDLGVRAFDKAETAKEGESLNLARRMARLARRRLRRRAWRLVRLARQLKREGLIEDAHWFQHQPAAQKSTWALRVEGLDRLLADEEWARVIYHLSKHRGFHWISRADKKRAEADKQGEGGKVAQGLAATERLMKERSYRSAAEMMLQEFPQAQRNKRGEYGRALSRKLLSEELTLLFHRQRELGNRRAGESFERALLDQKSGLFWVQKPALTGKALLEMLGRCTFEKNEFRAPRASFSAERHVWLTRLNNLRIIVDGHTRPLSDGERRMALPLPYQGTSEKFSYRHLRNALVKAGLLPDSFRFAGLSYPSDRQVEQEHAKDPETDALVRLSAWHELRQALKKAGLETEWKGLAAAAIEGRPDLLNDIARVLSVFKDDDEVSAELAKLPLPGEPGRMAEALRDIRFDRFHALSLKALQKIIPYMETGLRYDEACREAGYHHSLTHKSGRGEHDLLPPFYSKRDERGRMLLREDIDAPRNPVVLRALNQARKVMNALVRRYGAPAEVHIEMARDLSRAIDERRKIEREQEAFRKRNEDDKAEFASSFSIVGAPRGGDFEKWRLYREQQGKCAYSLEPIDLHRLLEPGYVEVDHALPYSRSFDNSKSNKVLAFVKENRDKGNRTPYEYLGGVHGSERWRNFVAAVETNKAYRQAKRSRLLRKDFGKKESEEFKERNLSDTRYICRFFKNYVEAYLRLAEGSDARRCVVLSGQLTAFLRARWGLLKIRGDSDRHHALDAAVVAACSHAMVKRLSDYSRRRELDCVREGFIDAETGEIVNPAMLQQAQQHFPDPWPHFRHELQARLWIDDPALLRAEVERLGSYPSEALALVRPLFVSRAVDRRTIGKIHDATIFSTKGVRSTQAVERVVLTDLTLAKLEGMVGKDDARNSALYAALKFRLEEAGGDAKKAFGPQSQKMFKPTRAGGKAPEVHSIRIEVAKRSGLLVRGGVADLGEMLFVDVFRGDRGFFLVPRYAAAGKDIRQPPIAAKEGNYVFSLTKNELVEVALGDEVTVGYFVMYESDGRVTLRAHDQPQPDKRFFRKSVTGARRISKFNVDILGYIHLTKPEPNRGLA